MGFTSQQGNGDSATDGNRIVISGMAGLYPKAHNVKELAEILYTKTNPVSHEGIRFEFAHCEAPRCMGSAPELDLFDAQYFKVHYHLSIMMDPMSRKLLEQVYHAIFDAGIRPESLSGKKVGVFVATSSCDAEKFSTFCKRSKVGIIGASKAMFSNRISYWLNSRGPSVTIDGSCCGAFLALQAAQGALARGECESAVVTGSRIWLHPHSVIAHDRIIIHTSRDNKTRSFDENASGPVFSEAINVLFLQKKQDALRVYAELRHVKCEYDTLQKGDDGLCYGFYREPHNLSNFLKSFYEEINMDPQDVDYVEAFGSAVPSADKAELEALAAVCGAAQHRALPVGSVASNIGYTETASGIAAITKVVLGYHTGILAANLNLDAPRSDVACLNDGRIRLLQEDHPFREGYAAINGLSMTGLNAHVLLFNRYKPKNPDRYHTDIPYLVTVSGRHESAVKKILDELESHPIDPEQLALLHNIHLKNSFLHMGRGFTILATAKEKGTVCLKQQSDYFNDVSRPLWFVYSGMGSQWAGMGQHLMQLPIFAAAIHKCKKVLEPKGVDIINIITSKDKEIFENILNSFVGIAAIQIGLTDVLKELGLIPDNIIGHSVGELGCAYADGCLTAEEMILAAYYRGLVSLQTPFIRGAMAAVGAGYKQVMKICPQDIEVACHNSTESCTISGPADSVKMFKEKLVKADIFCKEVASSNIAYHSRYIAEAGPALLSYLRKVIKNPKARSERWISTSVPEQSWSEPLAQYGGAEYHTNNLLNPVLFEEASRLIPSKAVLVEVAPHGLLQAILKRSLPDSCLNIPLTRRGNKDLVFLLEAIGKIYVNGFLPKVSALYPKIEFPVSTGTPMLSHMVGWAHEEKWSWPQYDGGNSRLGATCRFVVSIHDDEYKYLQGNILREKNVYPISAVLIDVWDTLAMSRELSKRAFSVEFRDVRVHSLPLLHERRQLRLNVSLQKASGRFEVLDDVTKVATGYIIADLFAEESSDLKHGEDKKEEFSITSEDIYEIAFNRDYRYCDDFRSIHSATNCLSKARVVWNTNWVTFIDGLFQLDALRNSHETVSKLAFVKKLHLNTRVQRKSQVKGLDEKDVMTAYVLEGDRIRCGGVSLEGINYLDLPPLTRDPVVLLVPKTMTKLDTRKKTTQNEATDDDYTSSGIPYMMDRKLPLEFEVTAGNEQEIDVTVHYVGWNPMDNETINEGLLMNGQDFENTIDVDFSGKLNNGERVMGVAWHAGARWRARRTLLWPAPAHWRLRDAATAPRAYCAAYYCLVLKYQLQPGMRIYVEDGLSAFGQAAIALAAALRCEVFSSVATAQEKRYLLTLFPQMKDDHVCSFNDFTEMIMSVTKGKGCDFVLTSPRGELMMESLGCAKDSGITIITNPEKDITFGIFNLSRARSVVFLNFSSIFQKENVDIHKRLQRLVAEGIASGVVRPLTQLPHSPVALHRLNTASPIGSVLLRLRQAPPTEIGFSCSPESIHVIICINEAFGLVLAERLVRAGARQLHIHCPNRNNYIKEILKLRFKQQLKIHISSENLNTQNSVHKLLMESEQRASVEGIHIITLEKSTKPSVNDTYISIHDIDLASRKLCSNLKYFTVLTEDDVGESTCFSRNHHKFPATMLKLSALLKINSRGAASREAITRLEAVKALEEAVTTQESMVLVAKQVGTVPSLVMDIAQSTNISITEKTDPDSTLEELGVNAALIKTVTDKLLYGHDVVLYERDLLTVTVQRLRDIEEILYRSEFEECKGLNKFFSCVEPDELLANTEMVFPTTLVKTNMSDEEIAVKEPHLMIVCGMEGTHARFGLLCERLQLPALVLQPGLSRPEESPAELADRYVKILLARMELKDHFYLLGYETGVAVALEMVSILEEHGLTGTVFCIGGGPESISAEIDEVASSFGSDEALQAAVTRHMARLMRGDAHSTQYARQAAAAALARLRRARRCALPPRALRSQLIALLPAGAQWARAELQRHSLRPVLVHRLRAPPGRGAADPRCAALVNRHLSENIRTRFRSMNRCERYCLEGNGYIYH